MELGGPRCCEICASRPPWRSVTTHMSGCTTAGALIWNALLLLTVVGAATGAADCALRPQSTCICDMSDNSGYIDLTKISNNNGANTKPFFTGVKVTDGENDDYIYSYNPCTGFTDGTCKNNNAVCQSSKASCGRQYAKFDMSASPPTIAYYYGDLFPDVSFGNRSSVIKLVCDNTAVDATMKYDTEDPKAVYHFILTSKYVCVQPNPMVPTTPSYSPKPNVLTLGWIIDMSFLFLAITYLLAGTSFMYFRRGARGKEALPQYEFWSTVPGLIKEGSMFIFLKVKGLRGGGGGYEQL